MDRLWFKVWYRVVFWYLVLAWIALINHVVRSIALILTRNNLFPLLEKKGHCKR